MSVRYFDICDTAYKRDSSTCKVTVLRVNSDGKVYEDEPTEYERERFSRHFLDAGVISEEIAYKLALDPSISY